MTITLPYDYPDTRDYLKKSSCVTRVIWVCNVDYPYHFDSTYQVFCADKPFDVIVECPKDGNIEDFITTINYVGKGESKGVFRGNIREVKNFFDIVGRTLNVIA